MFVYTVDPVQLDSVWMFVYTVDAVQLDSVWMFVYTVDAVQLDSVWMFVYTVDPVRLCYQRQSAGWVITVTYCMRTPHITDLVMNCDISNTIVIDTIVYH